ncbi:helix-turn-helix transcriptional regulator [Actinoplanes sp. L3-i22]|uniref:helix-turn-helix domain-containing protein n=1 Tax=Actinoplanes sp. L3-i22 TaxID=2836373 RepID=UPI001C7810B6|nr:helix-turn-helix transcriptional regulator [Actinoplanes sp. L3-i22]BCY09268.1 transcriptional regulator [Actinoplanes sp. L3-i22]
MPGDPGPMVRRRQLSALLRHYRLAAGMSVKEVADQLFEASSKITRIEKGQRLATVRDIVDLCRIYDLSDEIRDRLTELAKGSRERQWWQRSDLSPPLQILIGMEGSAKSILEYELTYFPGLLQTPDYADAVLRSWTTDPDKRSEFVAVRMRRQAIFESPDPPDVQTIVDEAVVRRMVGGPQIMREQLAHIIERVSSGCCDLRVMPFSAGSYQGLHNGFTVLSFGNFADLPGETLIPGVVYLELSDEARYLDASDDVAYHVSRFEKMRAQALTTEESIDLLRTAAADI